MSNKELYDKDVKEMRERFIREGRKFFYRKDPNDTNKYAPKWQVGIGNEEDKLIDIHIAKVWQEHDAALLVEALNNPAHGRD